MIPTPEQLAAVLPRCSAGLDGGDWTDDDERLAWATKVLPWVEEAVGVDWGLIVRAVQIAAETRCVELNSYTEPGECASDFQGRLDDLHVRIAELQRRDSAPDSPESDETGREVSDDHPNRPADTQSPDPELEALLDEQWRNTWAKIDAVHDACQTLDDDRRRYGPRHGDTWTVRNGRAVVVGSNDWPSPRKGTHESDLGCLGPYTDPDERRTIVAGVVYDVHDHEAGMEAFEWDRARRWSRTPDTEEAK